MATLKMDRIQDVVDRKAKGIKPMKNDSAKVKRLLARMMKLFPQEYDETYFGE
jgi:hypothetical protein